MALSNALLLIFFAACQTSHAASCPQGWTHSPASQSGIAKCYRGAGPAIPNRGHALAGVYGKTHGAGVAAGLTSVVPGAAGGAEGGVVVDDAVEDFDPEDPDVEELLGELEQP